MVVPSEIGNEAGTALVWLRKSQKANARGIGSQDGQGRKRG